MVEAADKNFMSIPGTKKNLSYMKNDRTVLKGVKYIYSISIFNYRIAV